MRMKEIKASVLQVLYGQYQRTGLQPELSTKAIQVALDPAARSAVDAVLQELKDAGLIRGMGAAGGWFGVALTPSGVEYVEDPESPAEWHFVQNVNVSGGNVQIGDGNVQNITYSTVLQSLIEEIDRSPDIAPETKSTWKATLGTIAAHPLTQTAIQVATAIGLAAK